MTLKSVAVFVCLATAVCQAQADRAARVTAIQQALQQQQADLILVPDIVKATMPAQSRLSHFASIVGGFVDAASQPAGVRELPDGVWADPDDSSTRVNDPRTDISFSPFAGYTQNTTSTARCGVQVVVGFNDSRAILDTLFNGNGGVSFSGVAVSDDAGLSFRDLGAVPPGASSTNFLLGEPSLACSDANNFFYAQTFTTTDGFGFLSQAIALSRSSDGGYTWSDPASVTGATSISGSFDDPRVAVDPSNRSNVYVSYRHVNFTPTPTCFSLDSTIEIVASTDGGLTFGAPTVIDEQCFATSFLIHVGSRLEVSSTGKVYVGSQLYTLFPGLFAQAVQVGAFVPGQGVSPSVQVSPVTQAGTDVLESSFGFGIPPFTTEYIMQGGFRNIRGFDLAVDRSRSPNEGNVYVVWDDGRDLTIPEFESFNTGFDGTYEFSDVLFSRSIDGGITFSPAAKVNSDTQPLSARGFDHYQPTISTDRTGTVAACWYDRRNDPQNFQFERFCAQSIDKGDTWAEFSVPGSQSTPSRGQDLLLPRDDMGQYDGLTSDFLGRALGFVDAFQWMSSGMNPDVKLHSF